MPKEESKATGRLMDAMNQAIGSQSKSYLAKVVNAARLKEGMIQAHTEATGNVNVICRTTDRVRNGDWIYIGRAGPNKYDPFMYHGFASGTDGVAHPGVSPDAPVYVKPPVSDGSSTAVSGTLEYNLDHITHQLQTAKGVPWDSPIDQSLSQVINWRSPVNAAVNLPSTGNRIGDVRYVILTNTLYVWTSSGWRSPDPATTSNGGLMSLMRAGTGGIASFVLVARTASGVVPADTTSLAHAGNVCGVTTESGGSSADVIVQLTGTITFPTALFGSYRGPVLVGTAGAFSQTLAVGAGFVQQAGVVVGSSELQLNLDSTIIIV